MNESWFHREESIEARARDIMEAVQDGQTEVEESEVAEINAGG